MKTSQAIVWLAQPLVLNGFPCSVVAADVIDQPDTSDRVIIVLSGGGLSVHASHLYTPDSGDVTDAIGLVNEAGFLDLRVRHDDEGAA